MTQRFCKSVVLLLSGAALALVLLWVSSDAMCVYRKGGYHFCSYKQDLSIPEVTNEFQRGM